jgi:hypothetical protein
MCYWMDHTFASVRSMDYKLNFITRVNVPVVPFSQFDVALACKTITKRIRRERSSLNKSYDPENRNKIMDNIYRLRIIRNEFKLLETQLSI